MEERKKASEKTEKITEAGEKEKEPEKLATAKGEDDDDDDDDGNEEQAGGAKKKKKKGGKGKKKK